MNAGPFGRRISLTFAALFLAPLLASAAPVSMDFKTLIDADNNERQLAPDEVVELRPGQGFAKRIRFKRG